MKRLLFLTALWAVTGFLLPVRAQIGCATDQVTELMRRKDRKFIAKEELHKDRILQFRSNYPNFPILPTTTPPTGKKQSSNAEMGGSSELTAGSACRKAQFIIPVVVHVFHSNAESTPGTGTNISNAQIEDAIAALNKAFANELGSTNPASANTGIQFCLAQKKPDGTSFNGIVRVQNDTLTNCYADLARWDAQINRSHFPEDQYLNIYVVNQILDTFGIDHGITGFATYPYPGYNHGIVIRAVQFGNYLTCSGCNLNSNSRGVTLIHEMGHYLGLKHTFEGGCIGLTSADCATKGDFCCDTPPIAAESSTCGTVNSCTLDIPDLNDQVENFMDYTGQTCQVMFTRDQLSIMRSTLYGYYTSFWKPKNVNAMNLSCCINSALINTAQNFVCQGQATTLYAYHYTTSGVKYRWRIERNGTLLFTTTTSADSLVRTFSDTGRFDIVLTVVNGTDSIADTLRNYIEVRACGPTLASTQGNWYFGQYAGLRFTAGGPIRDLGPFNNQVPNNTNSDEGAAVISNRNGLLLYYAGGDEGVDGINYHIYDRNYQEITGSPVIGDGSAAQGSLFLPYPNDTNRIYLFTVASSSPSSEGFRYNIIDRTTNSVTVSNQRITYPMIWGEDLKVQEAMCAIPTCDDSTYWLYVLSFREDSILTYHVGSTVTYVRGTYAPNLTDYIILSMKTSPDAKWLAVQNLVYKVNRSTGELTLRVEDNSRYLPNITGLSFSPNSRYLYRLEPLMANFFDLNAESYLYQMDLYSSNDSLSKFQVSRVPVFFEQLQIAPDNKIYISSGGNTYLGVINQPNVRSTLSNPNACGYQQVGPVLSVAGIGGLSKLGLPNLVNAKFDEDIALDFFHIDTLCRTIRLAANKECLGSFKWNLGDGSVSTSREPSYTYANNGTYVVQLISDGDTITKMVTIGIPVPVIATDSIYCDTTSSHFITISNRDDRFKYNFTATTGSITMVPGSTEVRIVWKADGNLTVTAYDPATGCNNSSSIRAKKKTLTNTVSAPNTIVCPSDTSFTITGNQPDTTGAVVNYQWYSSVDNVNFFPISGATSKNYKPNARTYWAPDTFFRRLARYESGCQSFSNSVGISRSVNGNVISPSNACAKGSPVNLSGASAGAHYPLWNYQWQKSYDSLTWIDIPGATLISVSTTLDSEVVYYRRLVVASGVCEAPSNVVKVTASLRITTPPQNITICGLGTPYFMNVGVDNANGLSLSYTWEVKESGSASWAFLGSGNPLATVTGKSFTDGDTVRCIVSSICGTLYSQYAILYINNLSISILNSLLDISTSEGSTLNLSLLTSPSTGVTYNWQASYDGGSTWTTIKTGSDNTLSINPLRPCDQAQYRAMVSNVCGTVFSNTSTVSVTPNHTWDVWMRDAVADTGREGFSPPLSYSLYNSPDLWVRYKPDGIVRHQNPIRDYIPGQPNYVYARVRNKGTSATVPSELYLYWTKASSDELWPFNWTASPLNRIVNWVDGQFYPLGSEINIAPISIPSIAPGDSITVFYPWTPPSPSWYSFFENNQPRVETQSHICILSRLVTCPNPQYGLSYTEVPEIAQNIAKNNNIATKNLSVTRIDVGQPKQTTGLGTVINNNPGLDTVKMVIKVVHPTIFSFAKVIVHFDDDLYAYWINGGSQKTGLTLLGPNQLELTSSTAEISNLFMPGGEKGYFYLEYQLKSGVTTMPESLYEIEMQQWNGPFDIDFKGGLHFQLAIGSENLTAKKENNMAVNKSSEQALWVKVYPNPFSREAMVVFELDRPETASIELYDMTGKLVQNIPAKRYEAGQHQQAINGTELADGVYYCKIKAGNKLFTEKLVLLKAQ